MSESLSYIDDYFNGRLSTAEKEAFEDRCEADPVFAEEVAFVVSVRDGLKQELHKQKREQFAELYNELKKDNSPATISIVRKLAPYLAAACLLLAVALVYLLNQDSPQSLADNYIEKNLDNLSMTMGAADSLQLGIAAYNKKQFDEAERVFKSLVTQPLVKDKALLNLGIVYLQNKRYDEALEQFRSLSELPGLYANPGLFYQALVLMKRGADGDEAAAKKLLEEIVEKDLPGSKEAKVWMKKL